MSARQASNCALYVGSVRHRRFDKVKHAFAARLYFAYLDLDEIDLAFAGRLWWSDRRLAPLRFRRRDYFGDPTRPLDAEVRDAVAQRTGLRPDGPVRLLTNLRSFGYLFNPVSFYYCFDREQHLVAVLAEITNTPWRERHHYVVAADSAGQHTLRAAFRKEFHVSPFQPMEQEYRWALTVPGERLAVHMQNHRGGDKVFDATLLVERRAWTTANLWWAWFRHPCMTAKAILTIYWHALRLWLKRAPFHWHPKKRGARCPARS